MFNLEYIRFETFTFSAHIPTCGWPRKEEITLINSSFGWKVSYKSTLWSCGSLDSALLWIEKILKSWAAQDAKCGVLPEYGSKK